MSIARSFLSGIIPSGIVFVGGKTITSAGSSATLDVGSGLSGGFSLGAAQGDFAICFASQSAAPPYTSAIAMNGGFSPGWTEQFAVEAIDTKYCSLSCATKYFSTLSGTTVRFDKVNRSDTGACAVVMVFRNVHASTQLDVAIQTATSTNSAVPNPPSITPSTSGAIVIGVGAGAHAAGTQTFTSADLPRKFSTAGLNTSLNDASIGAGFARWVSGAFDPAAFAFSGSDGSSYSACAATIALRPAA